MVRPSCFGFNEETAANNAFQRKDEALSVVEVSKQARAEFDLFVKKLRAAGVSVIVAHDTPNPPKTDAVFPNNWISFHQEGFIVTYPMFSAIRRRERRRKVIETVLSQGFVSKTRLNFEFNEKLNRFLEGTGSIVFDHQHRLAYACTSVRTDTELLEELCQKLAYRPVSFNAVDAEGQPIYHTNVMMALGETFAVVCLEAVADPTEKAALMDIFAQTGKILVPITFDQMNRFAGNMLQVRNFDGERILVMSSQAYQSLSPAQIETLEAHTQLLHSPIPTIETFGGGSARCMMAEVFLPCSQIPDKNHLPN